MPEASHRSKGDVCVHRHRSKTDVCVQYSRQKEGGGYTRSIMTPCEGVRYGRCSFDYYHVMSPVTLSAKSTRKVLHLHKSLNAHIPSTIVDKTLR